MRLLLIALGMLGAAAVWDRWISRQLDILDDLGPVTWRQASDLEDAIADTDRRWNVPTGWSKAHVGGITTREVEARALAAIIAEREARAAGPTKPASHVTPFRKRARVS